MDLNQITVDTIDLDRSALFYEKLGMRRIVWSPPRYARYEAANGSTTLSLHLVDEVQGGVALYFESADMDQEVARLKAAGLNFETEPKDQSWRWREAWLRDPDGHRICIYHAGPDRRFPPWRVDAAKDGESVEEK